MLSGEERYNNIFLFRHGRTIAKDEDNEALSPEGIRQAQEAGKIVIEKINNRYFHLRRNDLKLDEMKGILKAHSPTPRSSNFLEIMLECVNRNFAGGRFFGNLIDIQSPEINESGKIKQFIYQFSSLAGIQLFVGHNPGIILSMQDYSKEGFGFEGDEKFLHENLEGGGYYINPSERKIYSLNQ